MLPTVRPSDIDDLVLSPNAWDSQKFGSQTIVKGTEEMTTAVAKGYEGRALILISLKIREWSR